MTAEAQRKSAALSDEIAARSHVAEMLNNTLTNMADPVVIADAARQCRAHQSRRRAKCSADLSDIGNPQAYRSFERFYPDGVTPLPFEQSPLLRAFRGEIVENFEFIARPLGSDRKSYLIANGRPLRNESRQTAGRGDGLSRHHPDQEGGTRAARERADGARHHRHRARRLRADRSTGTITEWSPHAETMFGWPREEALGRKYCRTDLLFRAIRPNWPRATATSSTRSTGAAAATGSRSKRSAATARRSRSKCR